MANVIRHKRGTSNPAAGSFSQTAELLVNTSDGGVFTKTDGGSVVEVGANASNLSTGTVPSGRLSGSYGISVTGSSASCTGNANTASSLQTARTIALSGDVSGSASFNGGSNVTISATVADDSHNHVVSNVDGLQTALDAKASLSGATFTGEVQINARLDIGAPGNDHEIRIYKTDNNVSDHIQFYNGTTRIGEIGGEDTSWLRINQETNTNIFTPRYIRADNGFFVDGTSKGINGSGNFIGGTIAGASDYGTLLRSNANDTATGILTFNAACRGQVDALSSASSITPNFNNSNNFSVTLATNTTINNPSNLVAGQSGAITIYYSGNRTVAFGSYWKFPGGTAPTMTSTSGKYDVIVYYVESSTRISAQVLLNTGG